MNVIINHLRYTRVDYVDNKLYNIYLTTHCNPKMNCAHSRIEYDRDFDMIPYDQIMEVINHDN